MNISIVIPTYNRRPILGKCLKALENQKLNNIIGDYEVIVVDDGSTDGTTSWINNKKCFTYGSVINTSNFKNPESEVYKLTDISFAYFATGNVAISKELLLSIGLFDTSFSLYGWEDLELGERLKKIGTKLIKCPEAVGFHWHPPFNCNQIESLIAQEKERARMALIFHRKHSNLRVRFMIQLTPIHIALWEILCLGGLITIKRLFPLLEFLVNSGKNRVALEIIRIPLNLVYVKELKRLI